MKQDQLNLYITLTSVCSVHSNSNVAMNTYSIRYSTMVDPSCSTSPAVQIYKMLTSGSEDLPLLTSFSSVAENSSSIWKEPVAYGIPNDTSIRRSATNS